MVDNKNCKGKATGFEGLLTWVGDSSALVKNLEELHQEKITSLADSDSGRQFPGREERETVLGDPTLVSTPTKSSNTKVVLVAGAIIVGIIVFGVANENSGSGSTEHRISEASSGPPEESKPAVGLSNALGVYELHYCLAQGIRIDAARNVVDQYNQDQIDRFNALVSDLNSRCGQFRYRQSDMDEAKSDVELYRAMYQAQGRALFQ